MRPVCRPLSHRRRKATSGATCVLPTVPQVQEGTLRCDLCAFKCPTGAERPPQMRPVCHSMRHKCREREPVQEWEPVRGKGVDAEKGAGAGMGGGE